MKTTKMAGLLAAVLLAACGGDRLESSQQPSAEATPGQSASGLSAQIRLLGVNTQAYSSFLVDVENVKAWADGRPLSVEVRPGTVDLTTPNQAFLVGTVTLPADAQNLHVAVQLDRYGGYESPLENGEIDSRGAILRFDAPVTLLGQRNHAVINLNLGASLVSEGPQVRALMPKFELQY